MMNKTAQIEFDRITAIEPSELSKYEIAFLKARNFYLRPEQRQVFKGVLEGIREATPEEKLAFDRANNTAMAKRAKEEAEQAKEVQNRK